MLHHNPTAALSVPAEDTDLYMALVTLPMAELGPAIFESWEEEDGYVPVDAYEEYDYYEEGCFHHYEEALFHWGDILSVMAEEIAR